MFTTTCPHCQAFDRLLVVFFEDVTGKPRYPEARLYQSGFETGLPDRFVAKHGGDTENERVKCEACEKEFPLSEVTK